VASVLFRYVRLVFSTSALLLVATFTVALLIAVKAGIMGIPLALLVGSWFFKYLFVVLDTVVAGGDEPPVLSAEMVNPLEMRPLGQLFLIASAIMCVVAVRHYAGTAPAFVIGGLLVLALPASIALLCISGNLFHAAWPPAWLRVMRALGWDYLLVLAAAGGGLAIIYLLIAASAPAWIGIALQQMILLSIFVLIGAALFEHRLELGLDSRTPRERLAERDRREHVRSRQQMIDHAYEQFRHNKPLEGWREIERWLAAHARADQQLPEYYAVLEAACGWDDVRPGDRLANELIALLLSRRENGAVLEVAARRFASNPAFRPVNATRLAELATLAGKRALRRQLETVT